MSTSNHVVPVVALLCTTPACFPVLTHGAHVEPGATLGMTSAVHIVQVDTSFHSKSTLSGGFDLSFYLAGAARPASWHGGAIRVAGSLAVTSGISFDVYGELPPILRGTTTGVGVMYQPVFRNMIFPYVMAGRMVSPRYEAFVTLGTANTRGIAEGETRRHLLAVGSVGLQPRGFQSRYSIQPGPVYLMFFAGDQGVDSRNSGWPSFPLGGSPRVVLAMTLLFMPHRCSSKPGVPEASNCRPGGGEPGRPRPPGGLPPRIP